MSAPLALQRAIRARLIATPAITAQIPAARILDRNSRPIADDCIVLGEADVTEGGDMEFARQRVAHTIHIWRRAECLEGTAGLASSIRAAILAAPFDLEAPFRSCGHWIMGLRAMRDPGGEFAHAVLTVAAIIEETAP